MQTNDRERLERALGSKKRSSSFLSLVARENETPELVLASTMGIRLIAQAPYRQSDRLMSFLRDKSSCYFHHVQILNYRE